MKSSLFPRAVILLSSLFAVSSLAQDSDNAYVTDAKTGVKLWTTYVAEDNTKGGLQWGYALPPASSGNNEDYIGLIGGSRINGSGWAGISHSDNMAESLLLLAWVDGTNVRTSFRYATGYVAPKPYTGKATLTQLSHTVNATHYQLIYHCQGCWFWNQDGAASNNTPTQETQVLGWVQSNQNPSPVSDPNAKIHEHNNGLGDFGMEPAQARNPSYDKWVSAISAPAAPSVASASAPKTSACKKKAKPATTAPVEVPKPSASACKKKSKAVVATPVEVPKPSASTCKKKNKRVLQA